MARFAVDRCAHRLALATLLLATISVCARAQASGALNGLVLDPSGRVIVGATIVLRQPRSAVRLTEHTDSRGHFSFPRLSAGLYTMNVALSGFTSFAKSVRITAGHQSQQRVVLSIAATSSEVTVTAAAQTAAVEPDANANAVTLNSSVITTLPVLNNDYLAELLRFLAPEDIATSGPSLRVNGVGAENVSVAPSAIASIKIGKDPYDAEYDRPGKGRIAVTTKAGNRHYHGSADFLFRDSALDARNPFASARAPERRSQFDGTLGGPVGSGASTTFLASADFDYDDLQAAIFARGLEGAIQENVPTPSRDGVFSGLIEHRFSDTDSATFFFSHTSDLAENSGLGGLVLPSAGTDVRVGQDRIILGQQIVLSPSLVSQFHLLADYDTGSTVSLQPGPKIIVQGAFTGGGAQADVSRNEEHVDLNELLLYSHGKHLLKFGVDVPHWGRVGIFDRQNTAGTYTFSNLDAFASSAPLSYVAQFGDGDFNYMEEVFGAFVEDDYHVRHNLVLSAGLRYDWQDIFSNADNFAPRFSFAYSPGKGGTVVRGGAGVFYDRTGDAPETYLLAFGGDRLRQVLAIDPTYPLPLGNQADLPYNVVQLSQAFQTPTILQYSLAVEHPLARDTTLAVTYIGSHSYHLFRSLDLNQPLPPLYAARPNPAISTLQEIESDCHGASDTVEVSLRRKVTKYFSGLADYRLGWAWDNTGGIFYFAPNTYDLAGEWGPSDTDERQRFDLLGTFRSGKLVNLGVALNFHSGLPYTMTTGLDAYNDGRADARPPGVPRNSLRGPGYADVDLRWSHAFTLERRKKNSGRTATLAVDAFNVFNRVNYTAFVGDLASPFFGDAVSAFPARQMQMSLAFNF